MWYQDSPDTSPLIESYNQMMRRVKDIIDNAEAHAMPTLQKAIEQARHQAVQLGEISLDEANEVARYIRHDVSDAAEYLMETSQAFSDWLLLDIEIIEQKVLELFLSVADKTRLELQQFTQHGKN